MEAVLATANELIEAQKSIGAVGGDVPQERREEHKVVLNEAIEHWVPLVGVNRGCRAFGLAPRTWRYRRQKVAGRLPVLQSRKKPVELHLPVPWRIDDSERDEIRAVLCSDALCDLAPAQIYAALLDEGIYLCSERSSAGPIPTISTVAVVTTQLMAAGAVTTHSSSTCQVASPKRRSAAELVRT